MSFQPHFALEFESAILNRGAEYFRAGRVRIDFASVTNIIATVRGSQRYRVELERNGSTIQMSCNCPYFDAAHCKHLWAVLLAADKLPLLQGERLRLVGNPDFSLEEFDEDPDAHSNPQPKPPDWRQQLAALHTTTPSRAPLTANSPPDQQLLYVLDLAASTAAGSLHLELLCRDRKKDGSWKPAKARHLNRAWQQQLPNGDDRQILSQLTGADAVYGAWYVPPATSYDMLPSRYSLSGPQPLLLLPILCRTGRCHLRQPGANTPTGDDLGPALSWQDQEPWRLRLAMRTEASGEHYELSGALWRGEEQMALSAALLVHSAGIVFTTESAAPCESHVASGWISLLRIHGPLRIPVAQGEEFLAELLHQPQLPPLELPAELRYEEISLAPLPRLTIKTDRYSDRLLGELSFHYGATAVARGQPDRGILLAEQRRILLRDPAAEAAAEQRLHELGWRWGNAGYSESGLRLELAPKHLPAAVMALTTEGWHVEAEGRVHHAAGKFDMQVRSGIDWFELHGTVQFGTQTATLPALLAALRRGAHTVKLGDGSVGLLPQEWLERYGPLAGLGEQHGDTLRFRRSQTGFLDALLASEPDARCDAPFSQLRQQLRDFTGIAARAAPDGFRGELRPYQHEALGWFEFLRNFGFGGCLADDMGLGKTVQVLALLEDRRAQQAGPSLAVVPRSLIFNWKQEAARFAPQLRVLDHTGIQRTRGVQHFAAYDLVLTTYGTLRNDAADLREIEFDYLILDESQAIKNASSISAKAVRLLRGAHRLALSGTPIENHLGELWSLFEFLNPGMLGAASVFRDTHTAARNPDADTRSLLARAVRPFILRRTKQQVAHELPQRIEQTLYCDLDTRQRKHYDELREHYRTSLLKHVSNNGMAKAKLQVLEALLRLRQAAIHPGLLDPAQQDAPSAKLDVLLPRLREVQEEGQKTLVFSQFTSMLAIVRKHLDKEGVPYAYLDGRTRDRKARVEQFQNDPQCKLFLISIKAGGVGLNLTAAQNVFLLDPWWNPAVEAQAIDRAHRIGQTQQVFACRLIARDTVEEKVLELQASKRALADAIIGADEGLIRQLGREDLELLLS